MTRGAGDRGVSEVIGFILVFAFLVLAFTAYQGLVVPEQNRQAEFQHNQDVQGDLQDLRNAVLGTAATGTGQSVSVQMSATYPTRALAQNLGISAGAVRTEDLGTVRLENARAVDGETGHYLDGGTRTFRTKSVRYRPVYSFYSEAPDTIYENTLVFNQFDDANITLTDQVLIDGRRITLVAVNGSLDTARQGTISVSPEAISASSNRVSVRNMTGEQVNVTVPTRLPASAWREVLADEMGPEGYVDAVEPVPGGDAVKLVLRQDVTYDLRMAKVGVGSSTVEEGPKYVTDVSGNGTSVPEGGTNQLVVEVRDRFNNPVSNVTVTNASSPQYGNVIPNERVTDSNGRVTFTYEADTVNSLQRETVTFEFDGDGTVNESVTFSLEVLDSDGSGGAGSGGTGNINPGDPGSVILDSSAIMDDNDVRLTLTNDGGSSRTITEGRYQFYSVDSQGSATRDYPLSVDVNDSSAMNVRGQFESTGSIALSGNDDTNLCLTFHNDRNGAGGQYTGTQEGDFFVLTLKFADGAVATYFVAPGTGSGDCSSGGGGGGGGGPPQTINGIQYRGNENPGSGSALEFDIENVDSNFARVESVSIESQLGGGSEIYNPSGRELEVTGGQNNGFASDRTSPQNAYQANNNSIDFVQNAVLTNSGSSSSGTVSIRELGSNPGNSPTWNQYGSVNSWSRVSGSSNWDIAVTLEFQNRGDVTYFFDAST